VTAAQVAMFLESGGHTRGFDLHGAIDYCPWLSSGGIRESPFSGTLHTQRSAVCPARLSPNWRFFESKRDAKHLVIE
jgi:hypothetical protein